MYKPSLVLGVMPNKRGFLPMAEAKRQKDRFMAVVREVKPDIVTWVDIDDLCENGIASRLDQTPAIIAKFKDAGIDGLFLPFCDFGEESVAASVASAFKALPVLVWGNRDETVNTDEGRGRDTQCGMFAATKVLKRHGVKYSYIFNCLTESETFREGLERFLRVANVLKDLKSLRIAKIGERPQPFMSVMTNEAALIGRFGVTTVPISPVAVAEAAEKILAEPSSEFIAYHKDLTSRIDCARTDADSVRRIAAAKLAVQELMRKAQCSVGAIECWPTCSHVLKVPVCAVLGELADAGLPISCETDVNGAITLAMIRACLLGEAPGFLADLTIRHPQNENAELLWHCGPFPYSLKAGESCAQLVDGQERWRLKQGDITLCRFDDDNDKYYLFCGEGHATDGPETTGTYVWFEAEDWKRWEERLMFGPYIHHVGGMYGKFMPVFREVARYLDLCFETPDTDGARSL